jgi:cyanophycinase
MKYSHWCAALVFPSIFNISCSLFDILPVCITSVPITDCGILYLSSMPLVRILALILASLPCLAQSSHGKLFIIGGGSRPDAMVSRLIKESGIDKRGYAVVLPMSSEQQDSSVYYAKLPFLTQGVDRIYGVFFTTSQGATKEKSDSVRNASLIYITGGDQVRFMSIVGGTLVEQAIIDAYKSGSTVAGTSAGAALMSKTMLTGNQLKYVEYTSTFPVIESNNMETSRGLGLLDRVIVDQHFVVRSRYNRLITAVIEYENIIGVGIDESTAILVKGGEAEVIGESQVIVIKKARPGKKVVKDKLGAKGITMDVYLEGEKFDVK